MKFLALALSLSTLGGFHPALLVLLCYKDLLGQIDYGHGQAGRNILKV